MFPVIQSRFKKQIVSDSFVGGVDGVENGILLTKLLLDRAMTITSAKVNLKRPLEREVTLSNYGCQLNGKTESAACSIYLAENE